MASIQLLFFLALSVTISYSYYISFTTLGWDAAVNYCQNHCNSVLITIPDNHTFQSILQSLQSNSDPLKHDDLYKVWVGLHRIDQASTQFMWIDNTIFNESSLINIWANNNPLPPKTKVSEAEDCVVIHSAQFQTKSCDTRSAFICEHCHGVTTKYMSTSNQASTFSECSSYCSSNYKTSLASIHSNTDMKQANITCDVKQGSNSGCFIGLKDENIDLNYTWSDGTSFDYAENLSGGLYPWYNNQPVSASSVSDCVTMREQIGFLWRSWSCVGTARCLCNMPSILCTENTWNVIEGTKSNWNWTECEAAMNRMDDNEVNTAIITQKQLNLKDYDGLYVIEYMYNIDDYSDILLNETRHSGIVLYDNDGCNSYYYVGISPRNNILIIDRYISDNNPLNFKDVIDLGFVYNYPDFYSLKMEIYDASEIFIYVNNIQHYIKTLENKLNDYIYIGIKSYYANIRVKSLFLSDDYFRNVSNVTNWHNCIVESTTIQPTVEPSDTTTTTTVTNSSIYTTAIDSTINPTIFHTISHFETAFDSDFGLEVTIQFEYTVINNSIPIDAFLSNITRDLLHHEMINDNVEICIDTETLTVTITGTTSELLTNESSVIITVTFYFCDEESQDIVADNIESVLESGFVERINDETVILIADPNSVKIEIEKVNEAHVDIKTSIYTTVTVSEIDPSDKSDNNIFIIISGCIGGVILLCIVIICVNISWLKHKQYAVDVTNTTKDIDIDVNTNVSTEIPPGAVEHVTVDVQTQQDQDVKKEIKSESSKVTSTEPLEIETPEKEGSVIGRERNITEGYDETEVKNYVNLEDAEIVKKWLEHIVGLPQFYNNFVGNGYDKLNFVKEIKDVSELIEIDVTSEEHQSILMKEIGKLHDIKDMNKFVMDGINNEDVNNAVTKGQTPYIK